MADDFDSPVLSDTQSTLSIQNFLELVVKRGATDLHVSADSPPLMRVDGQLMALPFPPLTANETKNLCYSLLTDSQRHRFEEESELDFSFGIRGVSRFRGNLFVQKGNIGGAFRTIPHEVRSLADLGLPPVVAELTKLPRGLVLVTGPTGSGKSTTLASMIDKINRERREHIVTVEDPIEFVHQHRACLVTEPSGRGQRSHRHARQRHRAGNVCPHSRHLRDRRLGAGAH